MSIKCMRGHTWKRKTIVDTDIIKKCVKCGEVVYKSEYDVVSGEKFRIDGYYNSIHVNPEEDQNCPLFGNRHDKKYSRSTADTCLNGHKIKYELVTPSYDILDLY